MLFALLMPLFLGLGAIAVDIGYWYVVRKEAQDAADAAALAAARELPNRNAAVASAITYVKANMPDAPNPSVEFPYIPDDSGSGGGGEPDYTKIEVTVTHSTGTFFGRLFGLLNPTVSRRAVAERVEGGRLAIYAHEYRCIEDALVLRGDNQQIRGHVHSDGTYEVQGRGSYTTMGTYRAADYDPGCTPSIDSGNSFGGNPSPTASSRMSWPEFFTVSDFEDYGCTNPLAGEIKIDQDGARIPDGVYCADKFTVDANDVTGRITVIARQITIEGDGNSFTPYTEGLLFFVPPNVTVPSEDDGPVPEETCSKDMQDLEVSGAGVALQGIVFDPCTAIRVIQQSAQGSTEPITVKGQLIGMRVEVDGDAFRMTGTGAGSSIVLSLFE